MDLSGLLQSQLVAAAAGKFPAETLRVVLHTGSFPGNLAQASTCLA